MPDKKKKDDDDDDVNENISNNGSNKIIPSALTKAADGSLNVSQLSMPPPRPIDLSERLNNGRNGRNNGNLIPSLLDKKQIDENNNNDSEDDLNPWEK